MGVDWLLFKYAYSALIYALKHVTNLCEVGYWESWLYRAYVATVELADGTTWFAVACLDKDHRTFQLAVESGAKVTYHFIAFVASRDSQTCDKGYWARVGLANHPLAPGFYTEFYMDQLPKLIQGPDRRVPFPYSLE